MKARSANPDGASEPTGRTSPLRLDLLDPHRREDCRRAGRVCDSDPARPHAAGSCARRVLLGDEPRRRGGIDLRARLSGHRFPLRLALSPAGEGEPDRGLCQRVVPRGGDLRRHRHHRRAGGRRALALVRHRCASRPGRRRSIDPGACLSAAERLLCRRDPPLCAELSARHLHQAVSLAWRGADSDCLRSHAHGKHGRLAADADPDRARDPAICAAARGSAEGRWPRCPASPDQALAA